MGIASGPCHMMEFHRSDIFWILVQDEMADWSLELLYQKILDGNFHEPGREDLSWGDCEGHTSKPYKHEPDCCVIFKSLKLFGWNQSIIKNWSIGRQKKLSINLQASFRWKRSKWSLFLKRFNHDNNPDWINRYRNIDYKSAATTSKKYKTAAISHSNS